MFTIQVIETKTGKPLKNYKVGVIFDGIFRGVAKDQYTNSEGEAHFSEDNGKGTIYVKGKKVYEGKIEGRKIIYL
ncbi:hypothetical protein PG275_10295 [Riemerella anatipestifer]|uniref:hypothetical protein n=1 Tax=Riemerella anatipestifer TaxID=34085 RepID=UPI002A866140|nr:hypothetical protein [Riemerella anatipestifer]